MSNVAEMRAEALGRATQGASWGNYPAIFAGFMEKGIPESDILPRVNVFTFNAWKALGRHVKRGEHGVRIETWIPVRGKGEGADGAEEHGTEERPDGGKHIAKRRKIAVVFHVSQTEPD